MTMADLFAGPTLGDFNGPLLGSGPSVSTESGEWAPSRPLLHWVGPVALTHFGAGHRVTHWIADKTRTQ